MVEYANDNVAPPPMRCFKPLSNEQKHVNAALIALRACSFKITQAFELKFISFEDLDIWFDLLPELQNRAVWSQTWRERLYGHPLMGRNGMIEP